MTAANTRTLSPRCPRCGWQGLALPDTKANRPFVRIVVAEHKRECAEAEREAQE